MSGPVGPGPFPPDQPHTPDDLRRDGHFPSILAAVTSWRRQASKLRRYTALVTRPEGERFPKRIVFPSPRWPLAPGVYGRGERSDEREVAVALSVVQAV